jgi:hypothetical protein
MTSYRYRFYDPGLQRWLNRDPFGEPGFEVELSEQSFRNIGVPPRYAEVSEGENIYMFVQNDANGYVDTDGLGVAIPFPPIEFEPPSPIGCAFGAGAAIGTGLCLAFPTVMTYPGKCIGNMITPIKDPCYFTGKIGQLGCQFICFDGKGWYTKWFPVGKGYSCKSRVTNP